MLCFKFQVKSSFEIAVERMDLTWLCTHYEKEDLLEIVDELIKKGAVVDVTDKYEDTALHHLVRMVRA